MGLVPPRGGKLNPRLLQGEELQEGRRKAETLPQVRLNSKEVSGLITLATGSSVRSTVRRRWTSTAI
jgi:hypothetical protein